MINNDDDDVDIRRQFAYDKDILSAGFFSCLKSIFAFHSTGVASFNLFEFMKLKIVNFKYFCESKAPD